MSEKYEFLPVSKEDMEERGWWWYDFLVVTGDAYVDHPSFGTAVIARVLEAEGYRVAILAQPDWHDAEAFRAMGRPKYGVMIGSGNLDSMVAKYTAAKKPRSEDFYSPGKRRGCAPITRSSSTPTAPERRSPACRSSSAVWKPRSAASPTTTTGRTRCAAARFLTRARIF